MPMPHPFPEGIRVGDYIQTANHFGDIFFEVVAVMRPTDDSTFWMIDFVRYEKYGTEPLTRWVNCATAIRQFLPAEMAEPVMIEQGHRFYNQRGQYDPIFGWAPRGIPLRRRSSS